LTLAAFLCGSTTSVAASQREDRHPQAAATFAADWGQARPLPPAGAGAWTEAELAVITNRAALPVSSPGRWSHSGTDCSVYFIGDSP
jgi:hypothetical protein